MSSDPSAKVLGFQCADTFVGNITVHSDGSIRSNKHGRLLDVFGGATLVNDLASRKVKSTIETQLTKSPFGISSRAALNALRKRHLHNKKTNASSLGIKDEDNYDALIHILCRIVCTHQALLFIVYIVRESTECSEAIVSATLMSTYQALDYEQREISFPITGIIE